MTKIVINTCYGGFGLSKEARQLYALLSGREINEHGDHAGPYREISRHDPVLVRVVETLGREANGECAALYVEEIPDGQKYYIEEYDGNETLWTPDTVEWIQPNEERVLDQNKGPSLPESEREM